MSDSELLPRGRAVARVVCGIGVLLVLARCGGSSDERIDDSGSGGAAGAAASGGTLTIEIGGAPPPNVCTNPGPAESACYVDCDCENGLVCLDSPASCSRRCGEPCTDDGDCDPGEQCDASCEPRTDDACHNNADCGAGRGCLTPESGPAICDWSITVNQAARKPCLDEAECSPGLHCVYAAGTGHCDVPCFAEAMRCPPLHECVADATATPSHWVCEFIGE